MQKSCLKLGLAPWTPGEVAKERYAWVRCLGVPLHAWNGYLFQKLVTCFGRFVTMDSSTMFKKRFDVARVMIQTSSSEVVNRILKVKINGDFYAIRVVEEPFTDAIVSPFSHEDQQKVEENVSDDELVRLVVGGRFSDGYAFF